jgi:hypothetical protein
VDVHGHSLAASSALGGAPFLTETVIPAPYELCDTETPRARQCVSTKEDSSSHENGTVSGLVVLPRQTPTDMPLNVERCSLNSDFCAAESVRGAFIAIIWSRIAASFAKASSALASFRCSSNSAFCAVSINRLISNSNSKPTTGMANPIPSNNSSLCFQALAQASPNRPVKVWEINFVTWRRSFISSIMTPIITAQIAQCRSTYNSSVFLTASQPVKCDGIPLENQISSARAAAAKETVQNLLLFIS